MKSDSTFIDALATKVTTSSLMNLLCRLCDSLELSLKKEIKSLENQIDYLKSTSKNLEEMIKTQQQYSRRNCFIIHGLAIEKKKENTDKTVLEFFQSKLGISANAKDLDRFHQLG